MNVISFPKLGIVLNIKPAAFHIGPKPIYWYAIIILAGFLLGMLFVMRDSKKYGVNSENVMDIALFGLVFGIIGARIYYVLFALEEFTSIADVFKIWNGGLAIYGGVLASALTLFIFTKVKKLKFWLMADTAVQGLIIGQIIGRWGNFFNREAFGGYTDSLFAMQLPVSEAKGITQELIEHLVTIDGVSYVQVHPTFLYEGTWNLLLFIGICLYKRHKKFDGEIFAIYLMGYGVGRFIIEGLRTDQLVIKALGGIAASQVLSIILIVLAVAFVIYNRVQLKKRTPVTKDGNEQ